MQATWMSARPARMKFSANTTGSPHRGQRPSTRSASETTLSGFDTAIAQRRAARGR